MNFAQQAQPDVVFVRKMPGVTMPVELRPTGPLISITYIFI